MKFFRANKAVVPAINRAEALACIPEITSAVTWRTLESGEILIEYPLVLKPLLKAIFNRFNRENTKNLSRKLQLDTLGSQVWLFIDGHNDVADIIELFAQSSAITVQEAEQAVTTFLRELGRRGLIILR
ncbi:MAG: PqqD family protein [Desulfopila sp.]